MDRAAPGVLCLVVGPSGVGKDSLMSGARVHLDNLFTFPRRLITRPADAGAEDHEEIDEQGLAELDAAGELALYWCAHGLRYGIRKASLQDLDAGRSVVVNVSRRVVDQARAAFTRVHVFNITAPGAALRARLRRRGRENALEIEARVARALSYRVAGNDVTEIANDADLCTGIERFTAALVTVNRDAQ